MIRLIREGSQKYPWILAGIVAVIVVTFVIGMGWFGYGAVQGDKVATVGEHTISRDEFRRMYQFLDQTYRQNQQNNPQSQQNDIDDEQIRKAALDRLITIRVWNLAAEDMGLTVTPAELRANILTFNEFQQDGAFDPDRYRQILTRNHLTPALFETLQHRQLLADKVQTIIQESVALTPAELADAGSLLAGQPAGGDPSSGLSRDLIIQSFLFQKRQRALEAYLISLKSTIPIQIHRENL